MLESATAKADDEPRRAMTNRYKKLEKFGFIWFVTLLLTLTTRGAEIAPSLVTQVLSESVYYSQITINVQVTNSGTTVANGIVISSVTAKSLSGGHNPTLQSTSLPISLGNLAAGASVATLLTFDVTSDTTRFVVTESGSVRDSVGTAYQLSQSQMIQVGTRVLSVTGGLNFNTVSVGATSAPQAVTISNIGSDPVNVRSLTFGGGNKNEFVIVQSSCPLAPSSLAAGAMCSVAVSLKPKSVGVKSGTLVISDDAAGAQQVVALAGLSEAAGALLSAPAAISFGVVNVGSLGSATLVTGSASQPVHISKISILGVNAGDFSFYLDQTVRIPFTCTGGCPIHVRFTPSAAGPRSAMLRIEDDASGSPQSVLLGGTGQAVTTADTLPSATLAISPSAIAFGDIFVASHGSSSGTVTLQNTSQDTPINISGVKVVGSQATAFSIVSNLCNVALFPSNQCTIQLTFKPDVAGPYNAALQIESRTGSPNANTIVFLSGSGSASGVSPSLRLTPGVVEFGATSVGESNTGQVSIENTGNAPIALSQINIAGANSSSFAIEGSSCPAPGTSLQVGQSCAIKLLYKPQDAGTGTASLQVSTSGVSFAAILEGTALASHPIVSASPNFLAFSGTAGVNNSSYSNVVVANVGDAPLHFNTFLLSGSNASDFSVVFNGCSGLAAAGLAPFGASCTIAIQFNPQAAGLRTASLFISDSASGSPQVVSLAGQADAVGTNKWLELSSYGPFSTSAQFAGEVNFGATPVGQTTPGPGSEFGVNLTAPAAPVTLSAITLIGANSSDFQIQPNSCVGKLTSSGCIVPINFTPAAEGLRTALLEVNDDSPGAPHFIELSGYANPVGASASIQLDQAGIPTDGDFGAFKIGASSPAIDYLINGSGFAVTSIKVLGQDASDFAVSPCTTACPPSEYSVVFTPHGPGTRMAALEVTYTDGADGVIGIPLTGFGDTGKGFLTAQADSNDEISETGDVLLFSPTPTGTSVAGGLEFENAGTGLVTISGTAITGRNASDFSVSNACSAGPQLDAGGSCVLQLSFTPSSTGLRLGLLQVNDDAANGPQLFSLVGTGETANQPRLQLNTDALDFGVQTAGAGFSNQVLSETLVLPDPNGIYNPTRITGMTVTGPDAQDFVITYSSCNEASLQAYLSGSCSIAVRFAPTALGPRSASLVITSSLSSSPQTVTLSGVGEALTYGLSLSSASLNLGAVNLGGVSSQKLDLTNSGDAPLQLASFSFIGENFRDYNISANACTGTLATGQSCTLTVAFHPLANGARNATLQIVNNAPGSPNMVSLTGTAQAVTKLLGSSASSLTFDAAAVGKPISQTVTIHNTGQSAVSVASVSISGPAADHPTDFSIAGNSCKLLSTGGSCQIEVVFTSSGTAPRLGTLTLISDAANNPVTISLVGQTATTAPIITPNVTALDFGVIPMSGISASQSVFVTSAVALPSVVFNPPAISGPNARDFNLTDVCSGQQAGPNVFCGVIITFRPATIGAESATLSITSNESSTPISVLLTGIGEVASTSLVATPNPLVFSNDYPGSLAYDPFGIVNVTNTGTETIQFSSFAVTGTDKQDVSLPATDVSDEYQAFSGPQCGQTLAPGQTCAIQVLFFLPDGVTSGTADLVVTDNAAGSPHTVTLNANNHQ